MFEAARICSPSVIFLDEVDALVGSRGIDGEHEASRRLKTEIFSQMDGITSNQTSSSVMVLATTNCPWDLDEALRRRLEKRIYIPLPDVMARRELFELYLNRVPLSPTVNFETLAEMTKGYSGSDIHIVCREASMMPMRRLLAILTPTEIQELRAKGEMSVPRVMDSDFLEAVGNTRPSVSLESIERYSAWEKEFGCR